AYDQSKLQSKGKAGEKTNERNDSGASTSAAATSAAAPTPAGGTPVSFNPIVRLVWPEDKTLFFQTAYRRVYSNEPVNTFQRWHRLNLSIQAGALK
ncbi:MAG TPA: hypothetical protein VJT09_19740, partial [Pyrinomonadaceae bacterium]|nr:hypothetical protein [Pyrinomonadaceae bacterium]